MTTYALEAKKRKFAHILESLTDGPTSSTSSSAPSSAIPNASSSRLNIRSNLTSLTTSTSASAPHLNGASDAPKRRRITSTSTTLSSTVTKSTSTASLTQHYLPSSRPAFLERLETFRSVTAWHVPSTESSINAAGWAKRGWVCVRNEGEGDVVGCGVCKGRVTIDLEARTHEAKGEVGNTSEEKDNAVGEEEAVAGNGDGGEAMLDEDGEVDGDADGSGDADEEDMDELQREIYDALVKRYAEMVVTGHEEGCPWRRRGCDASIQRVEGLLNTKGAVMGLKERYESIVMASGGVEEVPRVEVSEEMVKLEELEGLRFDDGEAEGRAVNVDVLKLGMCGWQRKCVDVVECKNCFRSLGLWLYRGEEPTVARLDAVESHLEYCPWRSAEAQDSEIVVTSRSTDGETTQTKTKMPGWALVYQAVVKMNAKRASSSRPGTGVSTMSTEDGSLMESNAQTPEQREKRTRDLMRRIKELRKPFNMKSLLRRKEKAKVVS